MLGPDDKNAWVAGDGFVDLSRNSSGRCVAEFPAEPSAIRINLAATAIVVVDMQNLFCADGPGREPIGPLAGLIPGLRHVGVRVIWLNWGNRTDQANLPPAVRYAFNQGRLDSPRPFLTSGSEEAAITKELVPVEGDIHVDKYRLSGFWDTPLDSILRGHRIDSLLFAGVNLDQCVYHTLADAHFLGYDCILLKDCAATTSPEFCTEATLFNIRRCMGFVTTSSALSAGLGKDQ